MFLWIKSPSHLVILAALVMVLLVPVTVSQAEMAPTPSQVVDPTVAGNNQFAVDIYQQLRGAGKEANIIVSPFSISTALSMAYAGSMGTTQQQMSRVLHFPNLGATQQQAYGDLLDQIANSGNMYYQLSIANALWGQQNYPFSAEYVTKMDKYYAGGFNTVDFAGNPSDSRLIINQWVAAKTADKIKDLLSPGDVNRGTKLVITNAIYFKGSWVKPFSTQRTENDAFYLTPSDKVTVPMMQQNSEFPYYESAEVQVLDLAYTGDDLAMTILLPKGDMDQFTASLTADKIQTWLGKLHYERLAVAIPKFTFSGKYHLENVLTSMGMVDAFSPQDADFSGMTGSRDLFISAVIHQAFIGVNETGTEASAATAVTMLTMAMMMKDTEFRADHPFIFLIRHQPTGSILFMGCVNNPSKQ
jgi:serpin B